MTTPNVFNELLSGLANTFKTELLALTPDELKAVGPDISSFFSWLAANPSAVGNPAIFVPKFTVLKLQILAAQGTVANELVASAASELATLFQNLSVQSGGK